MEPGSTDNLTRLLTDVRMEPVAKRLVSATKGPRSTAKYRAADEELSKEFSQHPGLKEAFDRLLEVDRRAVLHEHEPVIEFLLAASNAPIDWRTRKERIVEKFVDEERALQGACETFLRALSRHEDAAKVAISSTRRSAADSCTLGGRRVNMLQEMVKRIAFHSKQWERIVSSKCKTTLPKKGKEKDFVVQELIRQSEHLFGKSLHQVVATTATVVLDLREVVTRRQVMDLQPHRNKVTRKKR